MIIYISGGTRSGKSRFAQEMALKLSPEPVYLATARIWDDDFRERVNRHKADRGSEWTNIEAYRDLHLQPLKNRVVVIDCVTLWLTNFFSDNKNNIERSLDDLKKEVDYLLQIEGTFIIISNELGMGMHATTDVGRKFTDLQGWANQYIASKAAEAIFMVSGLPMYLKKKQTDSLKPEDVHFEEYSVAELALKKQLQYLIDNKTKPTGALGELEQLALQAGMVLNTAKPEIIKPHLVVFAADHGIARHGVSAYPQEVTSQMVLNFIAGGAAINVFCRQHKIALTIVDAGINYDFDPNLPIVHQKIDKGTNSFLTGPAMTVHQVMTCLSRGEDVVNNIASASCNVIGFGEMGIGNTSTASVLMSLLLNIPLENCIGKGTGLNVQTLQHKNKVLHAAIDSYRGDKDLNSILSYFGGFEILQIAGAMLASRKNSMLFFVDGFIATVAYLCAFKINPEVKRNAIFSHVSEEKGHKLLLEKLGAKALLNLGMRLGEGTGCALAFPLLESAVAFLNEMSSFEDAGVSNKS